MSILKDFQQFITKGNVIDLAVAVVIGVAFNSLIMAFVADVITPLIGVAGNFNFASLSVTINGSTFLPGLFLNQLISFIIMAAVVFFLIVRPIHHILDRAKAKEEKTEKTCPECLSTIPIKARRCMYCTSELTV